MFIVGTADNGETVYGDFQTTGHFISSGHVGSGHASYDEGAFVTFLIQNYTPDDLQFIMIDPKMVQLTPYEGIPHLLQPVIFNPEDARDAVVDLLGEMDRRFISDTFIVISPLLYITEAKHGAAWQICQGGALLTFTSERTTLTGLLGTYTRAVREVNTP